MPQSDPAPSAEPVQVQHPAAMLTGAGHVIVHGNASFLAEFGEVCIGLPASEALVAFPHDAFALLTLVLESGVPRKRRFLINGTPRSMTVAPRREIGAVTPYGVMIHLVPRE